MQEIVVSTHLPASPDAVWDAAQTTRLLRYVSRPLLHFAPIRPPIWPERWPEGEHLAGLRLFGVLPIGRQVIGISFPPPEGDKRFIRDNGRSAMIKRWDHTVTIEPDGEGTRYEDRLALDAGLLTPVVALFARVFYQHRQARWRKLTAAGFRFEDVE
ncbi:MAG: hypothetical protein AAGH41_01385 [Pseudomonadota bacterium]